MGETYKTYLHIDIEHAAASCLCNIPHSLVACPVNVVMYIGVFQECVLLDGLLKVLAGDEPIVLASL